jgi:hypothetical protein
VKNAKLLAHSRSTPLASGLSVLLGCHHPTSRDARTDPPPVRSAIVQSKAAARTRSFTVNSRDSVHLIVGPSTTMLDVTSLKSGSVGVSLVTTFVSPLNPASA